MPVEFASTHVSPTVSVTGAIIVAAMLTWYWLRVGKHDVPTSRRLIRRSSLVIMVLTLPLLVRGLSFLDASVESQSADYVTTWTLVGALVGLVVLSAVIDAINNVRLHANDRTREAINLINQAANRSERS